MMRMRIPLLLLFLSTAISGFSAPVKTESFWRRVLRFVGVSATPGNQKGGPEMLTPGDIYLYNEDSKNASSIVQGNYESPVFLATENTVLALAGEKVVKFDIRIEGIEVTTSPIVELFTVPGIKKLIGVESGAPGQVLVIIDQDNDSCPGVAVLSLADGSVITLPYGDQEDEDLVSHLRGWEREYDAGETKLQMRLVAKKRNGTDIKTTDAFLKRKDKEWVNVSKCAAGVNCGQPAISTNRKLVLFIGKRST